MPKWRKQWVLFEYVCNHENHILTYNMGLKIQTLEEISLLKLLSYEIFGKFQPRINNSKHVMKIEN